MMYTVADARLAISLYTDEGLCASDARVLERLNEATDRLLTQGEWVYSTARMRFSTYNNTLTLPYDVEKVLGVTIECIPTSVYGPMYEFLENGPGGYEDGFNKLVDLGDGYATFFPLPQTVDTELIAVSKSGNDAGNPFVVYGKDSKGHDISETLYIAHWTGGVEGEISAWANMSHGVKHFTQITRIVKTTSSDYITLYARDPATQHMYGVGKYHPDETIPSYRRYRIGGIVQPATVPDTSGDYNYSITVYCKKRYLPAIRDTDILLIQNLSALKLMALAITAENAGDMAKATMFEQKALFVLDKQLGNNRTQENIFQMSPTCRMTSNLNMI